MRCSVPSALNPEAARDGFDRRGDLVALEIGKPLAGIQKLSDFAVMAFAHAPSETEDR